jgi:hypothetical protein
MALMQLTNRVGLLSECRHHTPQADFPLPIWRDSKKRVCPTIVIPPSDSANLDAVVAHTCGDEAVRGAVSVFIDRVGTLIEQGGPMLLLFEPPKDLLAAVDNRTSPHRNSTNQKM